MDSGSPSATAALGHTGVRASPDSTSAGRAGGVGVLGLCAHCCKMGCPGGPQLAALQLPCWSFRVFLFVQSGA